MEGLKNGFFLGVSLSEHSAIRTEVSTDGAAEDSGRFWGRLAPHLSLRNDDEAAEMVDFMEISLGGGMEDDGGETRIGPFKNYFRRFEALLSYEELFK